MSTTSDLLTEIEKVGQNPGSGGYRRYAWTRDDHELGSWFAAECAARGLPVTEDRAGNQWAWWGDPDAAPGRAVVTGSHLDSVPDGGAFDGPLGVVSALLAVDRLRERGFVPDRPIGVVRFVDEEGARFGVACAGSRVITGELAADRALGLADADGITLAEALRASGRRPDDLGPDPEALGRIGTFVELHVEQGKGLVDLGAPVGVGSDIWPHGRWRFDFPGVADHAGTTALADRSDAMLGLARLVLAARTAAERNGCLATVGKTRVVPGGVNAIPSAATAWLDARGPAEDAVRAALADLAASAAADGGVISEESWTPVTRFDPDLATRLAVLLGPADRPVPILGTGAGHDAGILSRAGIPTAMIFVRNPTGVSHSPAEWAEPDDCEAGVDALASVLADLASDS
ncbi:allantoate amidohydrolase [Microlunatus sp. GCM10028923]|uniref:allantoate amidohydrolase n=1 Tax=Microlunatus sp. GCM10028923 TaxID=3273400 RepID=UPI00361A3D22